MSIITIINSDNVVIIDGESLTFNFTLDANIWAIQWDGTAGHIEYVDSTDNLDIASITAYQTIITGHATEKTRLLDEDTAVEDEAVAEAAALASLQDFDSVQSSNNYISDTVPTYNVKIGDTWFDPTDEILSIATEANSAIVWIGV
jgi:hypothetical protein